MESDQLIVIVHTARLAQKKAPARRKPDRHFEIDSEKFSGELAKAQEHKTPN